MSIETLDLSNPVVRLQYVYENATVKQYVAGHYAKYENGKLSMCGIGWALHCAGWRDDELRSSLLCSMKTLFSPRSPLAALKEFGFERREIIKFRHCPIPDCTAFGTAQTILEHLNEAHEIPIPIIGKLIPTIFNSTTPLPTFADHAKALWHDVKQIISLSIGHRK